MQNEFACKVLYSTLSTNSEKDKAERQLVGQEVEAYMAEYLLLRARSKTPPMKIPHAKPFLHARSWMTISVISHALRWRSPTGLVLWGFGQLHHNLSNGLPVFAACCSCGTGKLDSVNCLNQTDTYVQFIRR